MAALVVVACSNEGIAFKKAEQSYAIGEYYTASLHYKKSYSRSKPKEKAKRAVRAFMMGVITLSLPSLVMLRKAVKPKLLGIFIGVCAAGIILTGYIFNVIQPYLVG